MLFGLSWRKTIFKGHARILDTFVGQGRSESVMNVIDPEKNEGSLSILAKECRRKAEKEGFVSLMNDTKWRELCFAFSAFKPIPPAWRTLNLLNGFLSDWDREWFHHVGPDYCSIEWLEIDSSGCDRERIRAVLREVGVFFEESGEYFKVIGYKK
jgi:hypothetical protein